MSEPDRPDPDAIVLVPYEETFHAGLIAEVGRLKREVARLRGELLPPFSGHWTTCGKCGQTNARCETEWQPRRRIGVWWWMPERMRRRCLECKGTWFESPLDMEARG